MKVDEIAAGGRRPRKDTMIVGLVLLTAGLALAQPVRDTLWLTMDDSVRIDCTRFTPQGTPPPDGFPGIIFVHGLGGSKSDCEPGAQIYAGLGYVTLCYSVRGQGRSTGKSMLFSWRERRDLAAIAAWLAALPNVNDTLLGVAGVSQGGFHSWYAGIDHLPGVKAVEPDNAVPHKEESFTRYGCYGITITYEMNYSSSVRIDTVAVPLRRLMRADKYDSVQLVVSDGRSFDSTEVASASAAFLMSGAWHDHCFYHDKFPGALNVAPPHSMMYLGTGGHASEYIASEYAFRDSLRRWFFGERLKGENHRLDTIGPGVVSLGPDWQHIEFTTWPPSGLTYEDYWLHSDGSMTAGEPSGLDSFARLEHRRTNPAYTWDSAVTAVFRTTSGAFLRGRVSFRTAPLAQTVRVLGIPWADIWAKGPVPMKQISLQLYDEPPAGAPTYLAQISLGQRNNPDSTAWDNLAGEFAPIGWTIAAGHRLRIDWATINQTLTDTTVWRIPYWNANGMLTLGLDSLHPARVSIPVLTASGEEETRKHADAATRGRITPDVWPNPSRGVVRLLLAANGSRPGSGNAVLSVAVHDASGRLVQRVVIPSSTLHTPHWLDLRVLPDGIYFLSPAEDPSSRAKVVLRK
jgi:predicted acyl esterase